nr:hypothetical protein [Tanacetum cinerariifolium]
MPPRRGTITRTAPATVTTTTPMTDAAIRALIAQGVADILAKQEIQRNTNLNGDGRQGSRSGIMRPVRPTRECTYSDFLKCQPLNLKGTEGVVGLTQWFERMETVFHISNCVVENQVKKTLMKMMTVKYCPRSEIKKLEIEIWNLKVKGTDVVGYTQRFQKLALMCGRLFPEESDETMQEAIKLAHDLIDQKVRAYAKRQAKNKRKFDNNNQAQQQLPKRHNVAQAYAVRTGERKEYVGTLLLCNKCKFHHNVLCNAKCANCKKVDHLTRDCWNHTATSNQRTITCYEYANQRHYKSDCPELENRNHGNQAEGTEARGMLYALGGGETNQDLDDVEDDINA